MHESMETCSLWHASTKMSGDHWQIKLMESQKIETENSILNSLQHCYFFCLKYFVLPVRLECTLAARNQMFGGL